MVSKTAMKRAFLGVVGLRVASLVHSLTFMATLFIPSTEVSQEKKLRFEHLAVEQGLSSHCLYAIRRDNGGITWFGTRDGLTRFDGYNFTVFTYDPLDSNSVVHLSPKARSQLLAQTPTPVHRERFQLSLGGRGREYLPKKEVPLTRM